MTNWLRTAIRKDIVIRGIKVGVVVGTILTAINQGDLILAGTLEPASAWKIPMTYLVPYLVSTYASVSATLASDSGGDTGDE